jgi:hypothetical protein
LRGEIFNLLLSFGGDGGETLDLDGLFVMLGIKALEGCRFIFVLAGKGADGFHPLMVSGFSLLHGGLGGCELFFFGTQRFHAGMMHGAFLFSALLPVAQFFFHRSHLGFETSFLCLQLRHGFCVSGVGRHFGRGCRGRRCGKRSCRSRGWGGFCCDGGCGGRVFEVERADEGAEGDRVAMEQGATELALAIDEGAGGGSQIKDLQTAVGILHDFGMMRGNALVIDHDVIVLVTTNSGVFLERNHHFLSVF